MTRRAAQGIVLLVAVLVAGGCQCSLDTSAIDDLRCETDEDCSDVPGTACSAERYCQIVDGGLADAAVDGGLIECDDPELAPCGGECVPLRSDPDHCGACDRVCPGAQLCENGDCVAACGGGRRDCGGACVDVMTDRLFCGDCETRCEGADACVQGICRPCAGPADCDDRIDCTVDACGVEGCTNVVAAGQCVEGGLCVAAGQACAGGGVCAPCAGACVVPPSTLTVRCDGTPAPGGEASCDILTDAPTVAECLSCTFLAGMTELVREGFGDCDLEERGWVVSDDAPICPMETVVFAGTDRQALEADEGAWSIERHVNTTDFDRVRLCFDTAERSDDNAHFEVWTDTGDGWVSLFADIDAILAPVQPAWITRCFDLHPGGAGIPDLGIRFYLDAANDKDLYLDNVFVDAWDSTDLANVTVFADDFTNCGLGAWTVEDDNPLCPLQGGEWVDELSRSALEAAELTSHLSLRADETPCEDPWLSFAYGHVNTDGGEQLTLELDTGNGWRLAWGNALGIGAEDTFMPLAFGLAHIDERARDASVGVRFGLFATGANRAVAIDDVALQGKSCGEAGVRVPAPTIVNVGAQTFSFALTATDQMTVIPVCTWGGNESVSGRTRVAFRR